MDEKKDGFVIYSSYAEKFEDLTDEQFGRLMRIVCEYEKSGEVPKIEDKSIRIAFKVIKYELDANGQKYEEICEKRKKAIQARWEKKTESEENTNNTKVYKSIQVNTNNTDKDKEKDKDKGKDKDKEKDNGNTINGIHRESIESSPAPESQRYGIYNNVILKDEERDALMNEFPDSYQDKIDNLSMYMKSKGTLYRDHYATIMKWAREDANKQKEQPKNTYARQGSAEDLANFNKMLDEMNERMKEARNDI